MPMDEFQALSVMGFDGPDSLSPRAEVTEELARLEAVPKPHHPLLSGQIAHLRKLEAEATEAGGFQQ